jgi:hypothetical protein
MYVSAGNLYAYIAYIYLVTNEKSFVITMDYRQDCPEFEPRQEKDIFLSSPKPSTPGHGTHSLHLNGFQGSFPGIVLPGCDIDPTHIQSAQRLRMSGAIRPLQLSL